MYLLNNNYIRSSSDDCCGVHEIVFDTDKVSDLSSYFNKFNKFKVTPKDCGVNLRIVIVGKYLNASYNYLRTIGFEEQIKTSSMAILNKMVYSKKAYYGIY